MVKMNRMELENKSLVNAISKKLWTSLNMLRGEISSDHYYGVLILMLLHKDGYFENRNSLFETSMIRFIEAEADKIEKNGKGWVRDVMELFENDLGEISQERFISIIQSLDSLDYSALNGDFPKLFDNILFTLMQSKHYVSEFALPREIIRLACNLVELPNQANVFNPFAGIGSFGIELTEGNNYVGQEINSRTWLIGYLRLKAYEIKNSMYMPGDSVDEWDEALESLDFGKDKFDLVISCPPFAYRLPQPVMGKFGSIRRAEHFVIEKGLRDLNESGKLVIVVTQSFLSQSGVERNLKEYLVENGLLQMVISLPGGLLMHTGVPVSIIVINKERLTPGSMRFVDGKEFVKETSAREKTLNVEELLSFIRSNEESDFAKNVPIEKVRENEFNLSVPRYLGKAFDGTPLSKVLIPLRGERVVEEIGKVIRISILKDDSVDYLLDINSIEAIVIPPNVRKIEESCLLVSSRWKTLKPTFFSYTGIPIFISADILALTVDEGECDLSYLINELHSDHVIEQLEIYRVGAMIPIIRRDDLLSIKVPFPTIQEQKESVRQRLLARAEEKKRELALFNRIHGLEREIYEQNTYLRHTLAGPASNLADSVSNLKKMLFEQVLPKYPELLSIKISEKHLSSLGEYLSYLERDASKIISAVSSQLRVDMEIDLKKLTRIEIIPFLDGYVKEYNERSNLDFDLVFEIDSNAFINDSGKEYELHIMANGSLLYDLFNNLIENAVKHAFHNQTNNQLRIFVTIDLDTDSSNDLKIEITNSGNPFPDEFGYHEFVRKGAKFGNRSGEGYGGWLVNEIIKKFAGDLQIINLASEDLPSTNIMVTKFEINFPIIETVEHE
jgi:type I restriction enzyme M protein